ncbi:MAG: phosphate ABC transporter substrate-binding protein [Chloroflexota bacterium]|nr:MAG: phosphate ABC transporter substrate-binding protein [Chloroflexota bacterium]
MRALVVGIALVLIMSGVVACGKTAAAVSKPEPQPVQTIKITGAGSVYPALQTVATAFEAETKGGKVVFLPSSQTTGGISAVKAGLVDIGAMTRALKAEENDGRLQYWEFTRDALMVATHPSVTGVTNLTTDDLKAIYSGKVSNWHELGGPEAAIVLLDRPEDESAKILLRQSYLGGDLTIAPSAIVLQQEQELAKAVHDTPYSIGAFSLAYAISGQPPLNRLSLDGVAPTAGNVRSGQYKMVRTLGVLSTTQPASAAKDFLDFALGPAGSEELSKAGFVPLAKDK